MGCLLPVIAAAILMCIGTHWLLYRVVGFFMHPAVGFLEVCAAIAAGIIIVKDAPAVAVWIKTKLGK